nr:MAG TPA: putative sporulation protein [Caudoviricetes sp.]
MKKEVESLKRKTSHLKNLLIVMIINMIFFCIAITKQNYTMLNYYRQSEEMNQELDQIITETNLLLEDFLSGIQ